MKLNVFNRKKTVLEKLTSTYDVKLDASASQLIMDVLAKLYDNPVEAAIREYVSNAYDANVEAGSTEPVHLHVPTENEPYLEVSDTGNGLDYLGIVSVFANFGTSTKRDSNEFIGGFGIGSKSGLAISDKIHVSSVKNGLLNEFVIERKMCCLSQCYYFDGYSFENKDLVTKAYSKYAGYMSGHIERDEALEIIDHINNTCASEIATLNQMLSDLDPLIK